MALIGEMHYLTIGNKTYSIPISGGSSVSYLPTLTSGTEIGKLTVDSTTYTLYGPTPNAGTVTSVRVQATSPVQSSTSTAQSSSLNTTISLLDGYGDTKNPYGTKTANYVLAGPSSGNAAVPSFRALVAEDIPDLSGTYSTTDEKMKWTASTSSNTYYPLQSTSTATTSTANTLNSVSFYQYYNTAGGYRRLILGNSTAYTSSGGAYGTIRLYGAPATYYGDLVPGVLSTSSTGRLTANRTWTLPDQTGTIALTSDIPTVPTKTSDLTNDSGFITSDTNVTQTITSPTSTTTYYPVVSTSNSTNTDDVKKFAGFSFAYQNGSSSSNIGSSQLNLGKNYTAGYIKIYGTGTYSGDIATETLTANQAWAFPNKTGTIALTSDIPTVPTITLNGSTTTSPSFYAPTGAGTSGYYLKSNGSGAPSWTAFPNIPTISQTLTSGVEIAQVTVGSTTTKLYAPTGGSTYTLPLAANGTRGGVQIGYSESGTNYAVKLSSEKMYVTVPWTDTKVTQTSVSTTVTAETTFYPLFSDSSSTTTAGVSKVGTAFSFRYSRDGGSTLHLGRTGSSTSEEGRIELVDNLGSNTITLKPASTTGITGTYELLLPKKSGTLATLDDINGSGGGTAILVSEEYTFTVSFEAGTIGSRGYQGSETISKTGYSPISVVITYVGASTSYMPIAFLGGTNNNTLYCNAYRSTTSSVSNSSIRVTVFYAVNDASVVSLNTYSGEVS